MGDIYCQNKSFGRCRMTTLMTVISSTAFRFLSHYAFSFLL